MTNEPAAAVLLRGGTVFDGSRAEAVARVDILVREGRIAGIGHDLPAANADVHDVAGAFLLPGLIDCHVHLIASGGSDDDRRIQQEPAAVLAWDAADNARKTLEAGVTTVRDLGTKDAISIHLRDRVKAGNAIGPRIRAVGSLICMTGGHGWWFGRQADGADDVRRAVREQLRAGADCIKFIATGGVMTPRVDPRSPQLTEEELRAGIEEAHKAFVRAAAHAQAAEGIKNAVRAGIDSIEHGVYLDDEAVELMRERGTFLVPTLVAPDNISRFGIEAGIPPFMVEKSDMVRETHRESFARAIRARVRVAMGTDAGTPFNHHGANARELALMVECGMTPAEAIRAATSHAAELLDVASDTGTLATGMTADLLVIDGDPLTDISVLADTARLRGVMARGRWVKRPAGR
jgi:imidazolonepropionase-like amidohydrolase